MQSSFQKKNHRKYNGRKDYKSNKNINYWITKSIRNVKDLCEKILKLINECEIIEVWNDQESINGVGKTWTLMKIKIQCMQIYNV